MTFYEILPHRLFFSSKWSKTNFLFIEYLISAEAQQVFTEANYEYPVLESVEPVRDIKEWGEFKEDKLGLNKLGEHNKKAVLIFDEAGWK